MDQFCQLFQYIFHSTYNPNKISAFLFGHSVKFEFVVKDDSAEFSPCQQNYMCKWRFYLNGTGTMTSRSLESLDAGEWIKTLAWQQASGGFFCAHRRRA